MRKSQGPRRAATRGESAGDVDGILPACGEQTYRSCRAATDARIVAGGPVTGCPLVSPLPVDQVDRVLDLVEDVTATVRDWPASSWHQVARAAVRGTSGGPATVARAAHCVAVTGRRDLLRHADIEVQAALPDAAGPAARIAVTDALAAAVVSDVLPTNVFLALTAPLTVGEPVHRAEPA